MSQVPNGSIVTYVGTFLYGSGQSAADAQAAIAAELASAGMILRTYTASGGGLLASIGVPGFQSTTPYTVTMQVQIQTGFDYGSEDDVASIINHAIYQAVGSLPAPYSIPRFVLPSGSAQNTGQPTQKPDPGGTGPSGCVAGTSSDLSGSFSLGCWFSNLTTKGLSTVGLLAIVVAVAIGIFIFAPRPRVSVG